MLPCVVVKATDNLSNMTLKVSHLNLSLGDKTTSYETDVGLASYRLFRFFWPVCSWFVVRVAT